MDTYKIEKRVPIPATKQSTKIAYPLGEMMPKDSFFVPLKDRKAESVRSAVCDYGKRNGVKFVVKGQLENGVKGTRVWRIA